MDYFLRFVVRRVGFVVLFIALLCVSSVRLYAQEETATVSGELIETPAAKPISQTLPDSVDRVSMPFIENQGQVADPSILYYTNTFAGSAGITASGVRYVLPYTVKQQDPQGMFVYNPNVPEGVAYKDDFGNVRTNVRLLDSVVTVTETFQNSLPVMPSALGPISTDVSSFVGSDSDSWHQALPAYTSVEAGEIWPGVRVLYNASGKNIEKVFTVAAHADPSQILVKVAGGSLSSDSEGQLVITTPAGEVVLTKPIAFQDVDGVRVSVPVSYRVQADETYSFFVGDYDQSRTLFIDPMLAATYVGGNGIESVFTMTQATSGDIYIAGYTNSTNFPTTANAYSQSNAGGAADLYVARLSSDLSQLKSATYIGGSAIDGAYARITTDGDGYVYVVGATASTNFPTTAGSYDQSANGGDDCFLIKLNATLSQLVASSYFGSAGSDYPTGVLAVQNHIYVYGQSNGSILPVVGGMYDSSANGGSDMFLASFDSALTSVVAATYVGDTGTEHSSSAHSFLWDAANAEFVITGGTNSTAFPTTVGAYDTSANGSYDVFVSRISADLSTLVSSTVLGGTGDDDYYTYESVVLGQDGSVYVATSTTSTNYPTTAGVLHTSYGGTSPEVVVSKLSSNLSTLSASTYLGFAGGVYGGIKDASGRLFFVGATGSANLPVTAGAFQTSFSGVSFDAFIFQLSSDLSAVPAATYIGGNGGSDTVLTILPGANEMLYVGMNTNSTNLPALPAGGYLTNKIASTDILISQFTPNLSLNDPPSVMISGAVQSPGTQRVAVRMTVSDIEKAETSASVEYSLDGIAWSPAAVSEAYEQGGYVSIASNNISSIDTTTTGSAEVVFWWDAGVDIPHTTDDSVYIRITPSDPLVAGTTVTSPSFALNTQTSAGAVALAPAGGGGGSVVVAPAPTLPTLAVSPNSNATPVITTPVAAGAAVPTLFGVVVGGGSPASGAGGVVLLVRYQDSSPLVQVLQQLLNRTVVPVASAGAGSTGKETSYFGPRTLQSLHAFKARTLPQYASPFGPDAVDTYLWNALVAL